MNETTLIPAERLEEIATFSHAFGMTITEQRELVRGYKAHLHSTEPARCLMRADQAGTLREVMTYIASSGEPNDPRFPIMDAIGVYLGEPWALNAQAANQARAQTAVAAADQAIAEGEAALSSLDDARRVVVGRQGVAFGKTCWFSHESITGRSAAELNARGSVIVRGYMNWVDAMMSTPEPITAMGG